MSRNKIKIHLKNGDEKLFGLFFKESRDGLIAGLDLQGSMSHLTLIYDSIKQEFRPHITVDNKIVEKLPHINIHEFISDLIDILECGIRKRKFHHLERAWKMSSHLEDTLSYPIKHDKKQSIHEYPMYLVNADIPEFEEGQNWIRVTISDEIGSRDPLYIPTSKTLWQIYPLDKKYLIQINLAYIQVLSEEIIEAYGLNSYLDFIEKMMN